jgi:hypothetical protein
MGLFSLLFIFLCFLIKATPRWLLVIVATFSAFAVVHIGSAFARLPIDLVLALPHGMWSGDPWAWASVVLLADYRGDVLLLSTTLDRL